MLPFAAQPLAHCSATRIRSRVGFGSRSKLPTPKYGAAESRLEEQPVRDGRRPRRLRHVQPAAEDADRLGRDARGSERPGVAPRARPAQRLRVPEAADLLRGVTCQVTRPLAFSKVRSEYSRRLTSGAYSHCDGSPAFRL